MSVSSFTGTRQILCDPILPCLKIITIFVFAPGITKPGWGGGQSFQHGPPAPRPCHGEPGHERRADVVLPRSVPHAVSVLWRIVCIFAMRVCPEPRRGLTTFRLTVRPAAGSRRLAGDTGLRGQKQRALFPMRGKWHELHLLTLTMTQRAPSIRCTCGGSMPQPRVPGCGKPTSFLRGSEPLCRNFAPERDASLFPLQTPLERRLGSHQHFCRQGGQHLERDPRGIVTHFHFSYWHTTARSQSPYCRKHSWATFCASPGSSFSVPDKRDLPGSDIALSDTGMLDTGHRHTPSGRRQNFLLTEHGSRKSR